MWSHIALHVPHRLLFPILYDVIDKNEFVLDDLEPLMALLKQSLSIASREDLSTNYSLLKQLFLKLFTLRTTHMKKVRLISHFSSITLRLASALDVTESNEYLRRSRLRLFLWTGHSSIGGNLPTVVLHHLRMGSLQRASCRVHPDILSVDIHVSLVSLVPLHANRFDRLGCRRNWKVFSPCLRVIWFNIQPIFSINWIHRKQVKNALGEKERCLHSSLSHLLETSTEFKITFRKKHAEENQLELLNGVLGTLANLCLFDSVGFITDERFQVLLMPVVDQVGPRKAFVWSLIVLSYSWII